MCDCKELEERLAAAERTPRKYEVWVGTERTRERIVLETDDIQEAARVACADLSGCTFWGMKRDPYLGPPSYQKLETRLCEALHGQQAAEARCAELEEQLQDADDANLTALKAAEAQVAELELQLKVESQGHETHWNRAKAAESQLAEARALLQRRKNRRNRSLAQQLWHDTANFLSANPELPRAAAEQEVLEAMAALPLDEVRYLAASQMMCMSRRVCLLAVGHMGEHDDLTEMDRALGIRTEPDVGEP